MTSGIQAAIDNSNIVGLDGDPAGTSTGAGVQTGLEVRIPLSLMNYSGEPCNPCAQMFDADPTPPAKILRTAFSASTATSTPAPTKITRIHESAPSGAELNSQLATGR